MADPKGPETGQGAKGGYSARPRAQTLDLSATDVSKKTDAAKPAEAKPAEATPGAPKATEPPKTAEASKSSGPVKPADPTKPSEAPKPSEASTSSASSAASTTQPGAATASASAKADPAATQPKTAEAKPAGAKPLDPAPSGAEPSGAKPADPTILGAKPSEQARPATASTPKASSPNTSAAMSSTASAEPRREGVGPIGVAAAAIGGAAIAVLVIALFGKELMGLGPSDGARVSAAEAKLDAVGRDVAALRAEIAKTAQSTDTSALDGRLAELSKTIEASNGRVGGVEGELKALSAKVSEPTPPDPAIAQLAGRVEGLELRFQNSPTAEALAGLASRIESVEARLGELPTKQAVQDVSRQVGAMGAKIDQATGPLTKRVDDVAAALEARPEGDPAARLVVALGALDAALRDGRPFPNEFAAAKAAAGGNADIEQLGAFAAKGLQTREALGEELSATLGKLAPVKSQDASASVFDRLIANAGGVVKVTPKDAAQGSDPAALRAQVAAKAAAGDLEGALAQRGALDEAARAATEDWATRATALVSAETAIGAARTAALARLTAND